MSYCVCDDESPCLYHKEHHDKKPNHKSMTDKISLYDIQEAKDFINAMEEVTDEGLQEYAQALQVQEKNKVNAIASYFRELEMTVKMAKIESKRLKELADYYERRQERLKQVLKYSMEAHGIEKIETDKFRISFRKSESIEVDDVEQLDDKFCTVKVSANKTAIKQAIKAGEEVCGARIVVNNNLQIK